MKRWMTGFLLISFLSAGLSLSAPQAARAEDARKPARDIALKGLDGKEIKISALKGKVVLLDFWATWCPPCRAEIPHFKELYDAYKSQGLEIVGLSVREKPDAVKAFVKQNGVQYPIGITSGKEEKAYGGIQGIPTTFLIDKKGRIAEKYLGYHEKKVFEDKIKSLLAE